MVLSKMNNRGIDKSIFVFLFFLPFLSPVAYVGLLLALIFWLRKANLRKILKFKPRIFGWAFLGLVLAVFLSVIFSINKVSSLGAFALFVFYPLSCLLIADTVRNEKRAEKILTPIILSGIVITTFGLAQYLAKFNLDYEIGFLTIGLHTKGGLGSTLGNPNKFAKYLDLILPLSFVSLLAQKELKKKVLSGILAILGLLCLVLTRSLGGMAAIFVVLMVILVIKNWKIFLVVLVGLFILGTFNYGWITKTVPRYGTTTFRIYTWRKVVPRILRDYLITGSGLGTYREVSYKYSDSEQSVRATAHSIYFSYLCEIGILGVGALFSVIAIFFHSCIRYLRRHFFLAASGIIGGCTLSILAALIHGTVETFLDVFQVGLMFWVVIGLGMGLLRFRLSHRDNS